MQTTNIAPLTIIMWFVNAPTPADSHRRLKRIYKGEPLYSPHDYRTYHYIHIRLAWACLTNEHVVGNCEELGICGGTLISPDFVLTASHCVSYDRIYIRNPPKVKLGHHPGHLSIATVYIKSEYKHLIYSNYALMAGSTDYFRMAQKRHGENVFPHYLPSPKNFSIMAHDVALIQACEPFTITSTVKLSPMKPIKEWQKQYTYIVNNAIVCMYMGFGLTNDTSTRVERRTRSGHVEYIPTKWMRHTWRAMLCATHCNKNYTLDEPKGHHPCWLCAAPHGPKFSSAQRGDSGSPVICEGFLIGVYTAGSESTSKNSTVAYGYPLHCLKDSITPARLEYYRSTHPVSGIHYLSPFSARFRRTQPS